MNPLKEFRNRNPTAGLIKLKILNAKQNAQSQEPRARAMRVQNAYHPKQ